jgi:hypothetical protein
MTPRASSSKIGFFGRSDLVMKNVAGMSAVRCSRRFSECGFGFAVRRGREAPPTLSSIPSVAFNLEESYCRVLFVLLLPGWLQPYVFSIEGQAA